MAYSHETGTAGIVTVPSTTKGVLKWTAKTGATPGTVTITPGDGSAQTAIVLDAYDEFKDEFSDAAGVSQLGPGSTLVFAGTARYFVRFA